MNRNVKEQGRLPLGGLLIAGLLLTINFTIAGSARWWITSMWQITEGKYIFESKSETNYLTFGFMGRGERWAFSANVTYIYQKNGAFTQFSEIVVPADEVDQNDTGGMHGGNHNQDPLPDEVIIIEETIIPKLEQGIGDIYLFGNYKILGKTLSPSGIFLNSQIKIPIASFNKGLGSGEFDYGLSVSFKQSIKTFSLFSDIGFLALGDPDEFKYKDPLTWGLGFGKLFNKGKYYTMVYYQQYTKIVEDFEPPKQLSIGINYKISSMMFISIGWQRGFSETTPDNGLMGGIQWAIN